MAPPFDDFAALTLEDLQAFLGRELEEGLTWEAKGSHQPRADQVRKAVSGFANAIGGALILGAERDREGWRLPGCQFPGREPEAKTWLSSVIGDLKPPPRYDIQVFSVSAENDLVAVIAVEPIDVPPCMSGGSVFERVSGATVSVTDPAVLRSLLARGDAARTDATKRAVDAARAIYNDPRLDPNQAYGYMDPTEAPELGKPLFGLAVAPVGWPDSCRAVVFKESFAANLMSLAAKTQPAPLRSRPAALDQTRSHFQVAMAGHGDYWVLRIYAGGAASVATGFGRMAEPVRPNDLMAELGKAWRLAVDALTAVGATGEACVSLHCISTGYAPHSGWSQSPPPTMDVTGMTEVEAPDEVALERLRRELEREAGYIAWEPEE